MAVDLNTCKPGDLLLSSKGTIFTYVGKCPPNSYYDHRIRYPSGQEGTRINSGEVFRTKGDRSASDHNIVRILSEKEKIFALLMMKSESDSDSD